MDLKQQLEAQPAVEISAATDAASASDSRPRSPRDELSSYAWLGHIRPSDERRAGAGTRDIFDRLAQTTEPENWDGPFPGQPGDLGVLKHYVTWRFEQAINKGMVLSNADSQLSTFNTGLTTPRQDDIYGLFVPNNRPDREPWVLKDWRLPGDRQLETFPELPVPAAYSEDPHEYLFDWDLPLRFSASYVTGSVSHRFPAALWEIPYGLELALETAVARARKMAMRNPGTAVPMWQTERQEVQLLLPLSLVNPGKPDAALAISRADTCYHGVAVVALDKAYNDARLVARPDAHWLSPSR
ncbi:DUF3825 domain-containing protein [Streptomyces sp. NPDC056638]|uniref:DUF3825 domain-containing protein n=1 Tax=Streptomyces sp. NPDC056638 TaxID=3345887 RepID=UPI00369A94F2